MSNQLTRTVTPKNQERLHGTMCLDAVGRKANALYLGILLRLQIVAVRRKWLQPDSITFGEARAWQPLPETCEGVVEQLVLNLWARHDRSSTYALRTCAGGSRCGRRLDLG